jgi:hypothetical protein
MCQNKDAFECFVGAETIDKCTQLFSEADKAGVPLLKSVAGLQDFCR